ncbi:MAG: BlaR1 peptidase, partial [Mucilaginibacter sp.]|nr:BlaR1 peptidase [Mucilaginibacter sp.]
AALVKKSASLFKIAAPKTKSKKNQPQTFVEMPVQTSAKAKRIASPASVADTIKADNVLIKTSASSDSLNYIINGVKATKAEFKALDPDHIYAVEIVTAEQAKKIFDQINNNRGVLFITTDDSEAGKKFKEKIDELNSNSYMLAAKVSSWNNEDGNMALTGKAEALTIKMPRARYRIDALKKTHTMTKADGKWIITENNEPVIEDGADSAEVHVQGFKNLTGTYNFHSNTIKGKTNGNGIVYAMPGHRLMYTPKAITLSKFNFSTETNINHLSSKMIMVDGKEASERDLKKLSAANIESMSVKSGEEVTRQYGEKAKNGIVFIVTKKAAR